MTGRDDFGRQKSYRVSVTLNLEKDEKDVLDTMAGAFKADGRSRRGYSEATLGLLRIGVSCIRNHPRDEEEDLPLQISTEEALDAGLTVPPHNPKLRFGNNED